MLLFKRLRYVAALGLAVSAAPARADAPPLDAFAMLPVIEQVSVSPDGKHLGVMRARDKNGDYIIEVYETKDLRKRPVRLGADKMEITHFEWANNEKLLVNFRQDVVDGVRHYWAYRWADVSADGKGHWVYLPKTSRLRILNLLPDDPDNILITYDKQDMRYGDIVVERFNVNTGRVVSVAQGSGKMSSFFTDADGEVRGAVGLDLSSHDANYYARVKGSDDWKLIKTVHADSATRDEFGVEGFSRDKGDEVYVLANQGEDKAGIYSLNITTGQYSKRLFGVKTTDASSIITSNKPGDRGRLIGFTYSTGDTKAYFIDEAEAALHKAISDQFPGKTAEITSRSDDDNAMVIKTSSDKDPGTYYLLRNKTQMEYLGTRMPLLNADNLPSRTFTHFNARDGLEIPAYITMPTSGKAPWPAVVVPHGGPWWRDYGGYDEFTALLATNGYVVIQPEFRGSRFMGLKLWKAGDGQWGLKMQDDVDDAAQYLVKQGLADPNRLAIFGWSYGGYAAFAASERSPNLYKCSIAGAGVSDLNRMNAILNEDPIASELQRPTIKGLSPLDHVEKVNVPILVIHGDIDHTVPVSNSRDFVKKLKEFGKDYNYIELKDADHHMNEWGLVNKRLIYGSLLDWLGNHCGQ